MSSLSVTSVRKSELSWLMQKENVLALIMRGSKGFLLQVWLDPEVGTWDQELTSLRLSAPFSLCWFHYQVSCSNKMAATAPALISSAHN